MMMHHDQRNTQSREAPIRPWCLSAISTTGREQIIAENPLPVSRVKTINLGVHERDAHWRESPLSGGVCVQAALAAGNVITRVFVHASVAREETQKKYL